MAVVVVGGHSRNIGKTSVTAGLIEALTERRWTAVKITQYGHGICSADGKPCECATQDHSWSISQEKHASPDNDTSRFLLAGAHRAFWVRTRQGYLAEAMPSLRQRLAGAENVILESNSVMKFLRPDLYLVVLDSSNPDFKQSCKEFLPFAGALVLHDKASTPDWKEVPLKLLAGKPVFRIRPPQYVTQELVEFVEKKVFSNPQA
jgi:hypothetical protein